MGATWYRARAGLRRSWFTTVGLVLFVAIPFGVVLATTAGARRAHDALPEFLAYNQPYDTLVFTDANPRVAARGRSNKPSLMVFLPRGADKKAPASATTASLANGSSKRS